MDAADENTQLKGDFQPREIGEKSAEQDETDDGVEMNDAIEKVGAGCGTFLYSLGPFLMFALEGGEVIVLSIVGLMVKCEWNLSTFWVAVLQVSSIDFYFHPHERCSINTRKHRKIRNSVRYFRSLEP